MRPFTMSQFLALTSFLRGPLHAYALRQQIIDLTGCRYFPRQSTLQAVIDKLLAAGYIEECGGGTNPYHWLKARRGVPYELTPKGRKRLERELLMYLEVLDSAKLWLQRLEAQETRQRLERYRSGRLFTALPLPDFTDLLELEPESNEAT